MTLEIRDPEPVQLPSNRSVGSVFAAVFAIIGILPMISGGPVRVWSLSAALVFALVSFVAPDSLAPLTRAWTRLGVLLHNLVSPVALAVVFFFVITPLAIAMRVLGKCPLALRYDKELRSYWIAAESTGARGGFENQF